MDKRDKTLIIVAIYCVLKKRKVVNDDERNEG